MGKILIAFIAGFVLSDIITQKFPEAAGFKLKSIPQLPSAVAPEQSTVQQPGIPAWTGKFLTQ